MELETIPVLLADEYNYRHATRKLSDIKYIVVHYTGNVNDTPENNCKYFSRTKLEVSAHYFVRDVDVMQSVPLANAAFACGDRTNVNKASMYGIINNDNSVNIELCGDTKSTTASDLTKRTAAQLIAELLVYLSLKPDRVFRHYDVSGKVCPAWAVDEPKDWFNFLSLVYSAYDAKIGGKTMSYTQAEWDKFLAMMNDYLDVRAGASATFGDEEEAKCKELKIINDGRPQSWVTRRELCVVVVRILKKLGLA